MNTAIPLIIASIKRPFLRSNFIAVGLALASSALVPSNGFGVVPAPDGGYPGGNTAEGQNALLSLTTGGYNTAVGFLSLGGNTTNSFNTAIGAGTLLANTADLNTATGAGALLNNTIGTRNTANGAFALFSNITGSGNTAVGQRALFENSTGYDNTVTGDGALRMNTEGFHNTAIGDSALAGNTTGDFNTALGPGAGNTVTTANHVICIGSSGANVSNSCYIGEIFGAASVGGITVFIDSNGKLGTATSSRRFKEEIKPMGQASEALFALKPVTFRYKKEIDPRGTSQFGLVAEEVENVNSALVVRDKEGKPYSVRYDQVNAMLLNEFLKEHKTVQELKSTVASQEAIIARQQKDFQTAIAQQQKQIADLTSSLKEQAAQIQRVSVRLAAASPSRGGLEAAKPAPQMVLNNP